MKASNEMVKDLFERREKYYIERRRKMSNLKKAVCSLACCIVVILAVSIPVTSYFSSRTNDSSQEDDNSPIGNNDQNVGEDTSTSIKKEMMPVNDFGNINPESQNGEIKTSNETDEELNEKTEAANTIDAPVPDNPGSTGALIPYEAVWGGSYPNEAGQWVVLLTENTVENREKVFAINPTLTEDNTIFETATYSLTYLEDLMKSISKAVGNSEEFPFVSSVGLRVDKNCVQVSVTSDDLENIKKILAFDTLGGAIEIVNLNDFAVPMENQKAPMP